MNLEVTVAAPIVLFCFNRPVHVKRTLEKLRANIGADRSKLFVFCDGPRNQADVEMVAQTRRIVSDGAVGFQSVEIIEQPKNLGLANSIMQGVTRIVEEFGRVIVIEDDLETSPSFLSYMNASLEKYQFEPRVMHISGYTYPIRPGRPIDPAGSVLDSYFLRTPMCWGWATWSRAWQGFTRPTGILPTLPADTVATLDFDGYANYSEQYRLNALGKISTWFIFWYIYVAERGGLALFPAKTLVTNSGFDATGVHSVSVDVYNSEQVHSFAELSYPDSIEESKAAVFLLQRYFHQTAPRRSKFTLKWIKQYLRTKFRPQKES